MSAKELERKPDIRVVVDTNVFVPAVAGQARESQFYNAAVRTCWKVVVSNEIIEEYTRVMNDFGYRADVILLELSKLDAMNKYRFSDADSSLVGNDLAPRKDRHIVAPCLAKHANRIVTHDGGILDKRAAIQHATGAHVLDLQQALADLNCP